MIRLIELFAGIGAQAKALERLGIPHERTAVCEIDEKAYSSYVAIHGPTPNLGDITKLDVLPDCDLLTYSLLDKPRMRLRIITHVRPRDVDALVAEFRDICDIIAQQCWSKGPHYGYARVLQ